MIEKQWDDFEDKIKTLPDRFRIAAMGESDSALWCEVSWGVQTGAVFFTFGASIEWNGSQWMLDQVIYDSFEDLKSDFLNEWGMDK